MTFSLGKYHQAVEHALHEAGTVTQDDEHEIFAYKTHARHRSIGTRAQTLSSDAVQPAVDLHSPTVVFADAFDFRLD